MERETLPPGSKFHEGAMVTRRRAVGPWIASHPAALGVATAIAILSVASLGIVLVHDRADRAIHESTKRSLRSLAVSAAHAVDPVLHAQLRGPSDMALVAYQQAIEPLERLQRTVPGVTYVYTFRGSDASNIVFVLDPEVAPLGSTAPPEPSVPPGTRYDAPDPALLEAVRTQSTTSSPEIYTDEWGSFVSAYSPVFARDGTVECFVGVDMAASTFLGYEHDVHVATGVAFAFSALISGGLGLGVAQWRSRRIERDRQERAAQARLERITENVPGGVFVFEEGPGVVGRITFASSGFATLCGECVKRGLVNRSILDLLHADDRGIAECALGCCRTDRAPWKGEYRSIDGTRWIEIRARPTVAPGGTVLWHGFAADVTDRKHAEVSLREAKARAEQANRLKGEFVANTSHELRTPLAAIAGYAELLLEQGTLPDGPADAREAAQAIARNAEHMLGVIGDIVDGERMAAGQLQIAKVRMDAAAVACDVTRLLAVRAQGKGLELRFERGECDEAFVSADPMRVRQILLNLAGNAIKFTERGGVTISLEGGDRTLAVAVRDTGPGMTAEQVSRLFERFSQASPEHAAIGSGLGLAISRQLARLIGGNITVTSAPGSGTTFRLHLPRAGAPGTPDAAPSLAVGLTGDAARPLDGLRVLLAEDGADNVRLITHHLERAGAAVTVAGDGKQAAAMVRAAHLGVLEAPFDLVLMDLDLPGMDGIAATRDLRASGVDVPIIALTAQCAADDRMRALEAGCNDFATKPLARADLLMLALRWGSVGRRGHPAAGESLPDRALLAEKA